MLKHAQTIGEQQPYARLLGIELLEADGERAVLKLPYKADLGSDRVNGGAISSLVDIAATCAVWSAAEVEDGARGATVGFSINFLKLAVAADLTATATVRRRGGTICVGDVSVTNPDGEEVAIANVTYKLQK